MGGALGTILTGVFASSQLGIFSGQGYSEGMSMAPQLAVQIVGVIAVVAYTAIVTYILLKLVDSILGLRVTKMKKPRGLISINITNEATISSMVLFPGGSTTSNVAGIQRRLAARSTRWDINSSKPRPKAWAPSG